MEKIAGYYKKKKKVFTGIILVVCVNVVLKENQWATEMAQQLIVLAAVAEAQGSVPSTQMASYNCL